MPGILIMLLLIGLFFGYKGVKKYFKWIEETKKYKPLNKVNLGLIIAMFALPRSV